MFAGHPYYPRFRRHTRIEFPGVALAPLAGFHEQRVVVLADASELANRNIHSSPLANLRRMLTLRPLHHCFQPAAPCFQATAVSMRKRHVV
jgi:hypothetical protein